MLTKQEQEILDNAPEKAEYYMELDGYDLEYSYKACDGRFESLDGSGSFTCKWKAMPLDDLRKKGASKASLAQRKPLYGVGINDAEYDVNPVVDGKHLMCPTYRKWRNMLSRCYSPKYQREQSTYKGCTVCDSWLTFSVFAAWFKENNTADYQLDKDIKIKGNKVYSPETCLLVTRCINLLLTDSAAKRGNCPQGVNFHKAKGKCRAQIRIDGKQNHLGYFPTPEKAREAYVTAKNKEIKRKCNQYPQLAKYLINHLSDEKQGKTVVDAVNWAKAEWSTSKHNKGVIVYIENTGSFMFAESTTNDKHYLCNEEEFSQCVKEMVCTSNKESRLGYLANRSLLTKENSDYSFYEEKPRVKVEYVKVDASEAVYWFGNNEKLYNLHRHAVSIQDYINDLAIGENELYRKVETEIKTEKRWIAVKGNACTDYNYRSVEEIQKECELFESDGWQYIKITVEV